MSTKELYIYKRRGLKIKLREVAKYIGCSISLISRYENNDINISDTKEYLYKEYIDKYKK